jgi:hypothetical protein
MLSVRGVFKLVTLMAGLGMFVGYNNCSGMGGGGSASSSSIELCEQALIPVFESSYRPLLTDPGLCARCHTDSGQSPVKFASSNLGTGFNAFMRVGADQVDINAVDANHAPGVTGSSLQPRVTSARSAWEPAYVQFQICRARAGGETATSLQTTEKNSPTLYFGDGRVVTMMWYTGGSDVTPMNGRFPGALAIDASVNYEMVNGETIATGYVFSRPRLAMLTGELEVEIEGVIIKINGEEAKGIEPFLSARSTHKGIDFRDIYSGQVSVKLDRVTSSDKISLGLGYIDLRGRTDNPPIPPNPSLASNNAFVRTLIVPITVGNDSTARLWCLTATNRRPASTAEVCPGFETALTSGWRTTRPTQLDLATIGRVVNSGDTIEFYLWVANSDLKISASSGTAQVTFDTTLPSVPTLTSVTLGATQIADLNGVTDVNEPATWCVKESAVLADVQNSNGCTFTAARPSYVGLKGAGTRNVAVFARDRAGNIARSVIQTVSNSYGRITFEQLTTASFGARAVILNRCYSCHGAGGSAQANWNATSYSDTVARKTQILNRTAASAVSAEVIDSRERALIELWFTQTSTPVQQ